MPVALLTRPEADSHETAKQLKEIGVDSIIFPMLSISPIEQEIGKISEEITHIITTSKQAIQIFADQSPIRHVPLITVGESSATTGTELGFEKVTAAGANVTELLQYIDNTLPKDTAEILYLRGENITEDLAAILGEQEFKVYESILYEARACEALPSALIEALTRQHIDMALFFSKRTAQTFVDLITKENLLSAVASIECYCLSSHIALTLSALPWKNIHTANEPSQKSLISLIDKTI